MLNAEAFACSAASLCRWCRSTIILLVLLPGCSFHSAQLTFIQGVFKELREDKEAVYYWMLTLPAESLRAVPIIQSDKLFFSDGKKYLISIGAESITEIKALDIGVVHRLAAIKADNAEGQIAGALSSWKLGQTLNINESKEDNLAFDGGLVIRSLTGLPETIYFCSSWVYLSDARSSYKLCESKQDELLKFTHDLDDTGVVKRFNVTLDDQLLIDLERTVEVISY